jgi:hypothetical protein
LVLLLNSIFSKSIALLMVHEAPQIEQEDVVSERIEVGMPMILPYTFDFHNRVEGRALVEHDGKFYSVVEKIYRNDSLITVLQLNEKATQKIKQIAQEVKSESGQIPTSGQSKKHWNSVKTYYWNICQILPILLSRFLIIFHVLS